MNDPISEKDYEALKKHCHLHFGMGGASYEEIWPHFKAGMESCQSDTSALKEALKDCLWDAEQRCISLGLDPDKYSTVIKAREALNPH